MRKEDYSFKFSLDNTVWACLKRKKPVKTSPNVLHDSSAGIKRQMIFSCVYSANPHQFLMMNYFLRSHCLVWMWCACVFACVGTNSRVCLGMMSGVIRDSFEHYSLRQSLSRVQASQMQPICSGDSEWKAGWYIRLACMWFWWPEPQSPQLCDKPFNTEPKNWAISTAPAPPPIDCSRLNRFSALVTSVYLLGEDTDNS